VHELHCAPAKVNSRRGSCCGNQLAAEASAGAWRFSEQTAWI
jgi:hypothetical protein